MDRFIDVEADVAVVMNVASPHVADRQHGAGTVRRVGRAAMQHPRIPDENASGLKNQFLRRQQPGKLLHAWVLAVLGVVRKLVTIENSRLPEMRAHRPDLEGSVFEAA